MRGGVTHKLIIGDNYPALLNLLISYKRKIKVIYIDPPYGKDHLGEFAKTNYDNAITRDNLLSMLYPRLMLAKQLLRDDGVIFCSIDDRNQAYVKCLFDEVFGERNFISNIVWSNKEGGGGSDSKHFRNKHEYILCFAINRKNLEIHAQDVEDIDRYTLSDEYEETRGKYQLIKLDSGSLGWVKSLDYPIKLEGKTFYAGGSYEKWLDRQNGGASIKDWGWRWSQDKLEWGIKNDFIVIKENSKGKWNIYTKQYLNCDSDGNIKPRKLQPIAIIDKYSNTQSNQLIKALGLQFLYSKPVELIKHLLKISTSPDAEEQDIILDFFAGSGTTGHAIMELNREDGGKRQFILVTNNEKTDINPNGIAYDVTSKRLKRVMTGKCYDGTDNFKWLEKNKPYNDELEVTEINQIPTSSQNIFNEIDEKLYNKDFKDNIHDKIDWICSEFEITCKKIEGE